ncbi:beta-ketoacyl [acyl carrier protein] synthase domain-containing protein, partial [Mycolicibacter minnesotensis]
MHNEYPLLGADASNAVEAVDIGGTPAGVANRISYHFDLHGPSFTVDAMCASSHVALDLATRALRSGTVEAAIVVGVNISVHSNKTVQQERLGMRSAAGRCATFSSAADGFVAGEGAVALVLRTAISARRSDDRVHGLLRGIAIAHGGKTAGYTVPNPAFQTAAINGALADGGIAPRDI